VQTSTGILLTLIAICSFAISANPLLTFLYAITGNINVIGKKVIV
jgi:hypothetical protein